MVAAQALSRAPWWTIGLVAGAAAALAIPGAADFLVYERSALARGELWRLFTAHFVHYSGDHLLNNMLVLVPAAWLVEVRYRSDLPSLLAVSAVAIVEAIFLFEPGIVRYAGASGVSLALLTYMALRGLSEEPRWRIVCAVVLALIATKIAAEGLFDWQLSDWEQNAGFVTVALSHAIGIGTGFLFWLVHTAKCARTRRVQTGTIRSW